MTDFDLVENIQSVLNFLKDERHKRESDWTEVQRFVAPSVLNFTDLTQKIPTRPKRYTGKPSHYLKTMVTGITGYSISANIPWFKLSMEKREHLETYGVKDWLEQTERAMYAEFTRSNIYKGSGKLVEYGATYGHGAMLIDEDKKLDRLRFTTIPIRELFFDANEYGEIETVYREFTMTVANAVKFFGIDKVSQQVKIDYEDKRKWNNDITICHAVFRREDYNEELPDSKNMPFASIYIDQSHNHLIDESGYRDFPYAVFVWDNIVGTSYGECPSIHALDDIRMLAKTEETRLRVAQLSADPSLNVPESMRGSESVVPRGYNYYSKPNEVITPINAGQNYPISLEITQEYEKRVKDWFHVDFFLMLQSQQNIKDMTATAVTALQGEKAAVLSDLVVNLNDTLNFIIKRSFNLLLRQGKIPAPPDIIIGTGAMLKVDFVGPLAQAQKKYLESGGIAQGLSLAAGIAQLSPTALDVIDFDTMMKTGLEGAGIPQDAIREDKDIAVLRQQRAEEQARQQQMAMAMEQQKNLAGNADKLNQPVNPASMLGQMGAAMGGM
jgi:Bacteriophage head to tail connecting protein.